MKRKEIFEKILTLVNNELEVDIRDRGRDLIDASAFDIYVAICCKCYDSQLHSSNFYTEVSEVANRKRVTAYQSKNRIDITLFSFKKGYFIIDKIFSTVNSLIIEQDKKDISKLLEWHKEEVKRLEIQIKAI